MSQLQPPEGPNWIGVSDGELPVDRALQWSILPGCGGIVTFCGSVRDHSDGRPGVTSLEYEAYLEHVAPRLTSVAEQARTRWPEIGRLVLLHRIGRLEVGDISVVVVTSTPHRGEAFASAQFCIDTLKHTVPIGVCARATMPTPVRPLPRRRRGPTRCDTPRRSAAIRAGALCSTPTALCPRPRSSRLRREHGRGGHGTGALVRELLHGRLRRTGG
jgi:molybdopterin synthase catalytic subunit